MPTKTHKTETTVANAEPGSLYAQPDILARGRFSKSLLWDMVNRGQFPQPALRIGIRFTRWLSRDVDAWFEDPAAWIAAHAAQEPEEAA